MVNLTRTWRTASAALLVAAAVGACGAAANRTAAVSQRPPARTTPVLHEPAVSTLASPHPQKGTSSRRHAHTTAQVHQSAASAASVASVRPGAGAAAASRRTPAPTSPRAPVIAFGRTLKTLSGTGDTFVGALSEAKPVVIVCRSAHPFNILTASGFVLLAGQSGQTLVRLTAGTYKGLRIVTAGSWQISLRSTR